MGGFFIGGSMCGGLDQALILSGIYNEAGNKEVVVVEGNGASADGDNPRELESSGVELASAEMTLPLDSEGRLISRSPIFSPRVRGERG